jgi:hypothetical protein
MRITKEQLSQDNKGLGIENGLYLRYLSDVENGFKPDAVAMAEGREKGQRSHGKLYRAKSPDGGIVVIIEEWENGGRDARIYSLEQLTSDLRENHSEHTLAIRIVLEKLTRERNRIVGYDEVKR